MKVEDRMLAGSALDGVLNIIKFKLQLKKEQAVQKPDPPPEGNKAR